MTVNVVTETQVVVQSKPDRGRLARVLLPSRKRFCLNNGGGVRLDDIPRFHLHPDCKVIILSDRQEQDQDENSQQRKGLEQGPDD